MVIDPVTGEMVCDRANGWVGKAELCMHQETVKCPYRGKELWWDDTRNRKGSNCIIIRTRLIKIMQYRNAWIKYQILNLNLNMPKTKLDGDEEPTIYLFYKIDNRKF